MEVLLIMAALAYMVGGKHHKDVAQSAYKAGKEPPGLVKARMRHEAGGGATKPAKQAGAPPVPKGPGATRLRIASRWARSCEKAKIKGENRLQRWKSWYAEQAPHRDEQWRAKQRKRLARRDERLARWQDRWTRAKGALNRDEKRAWEENARRDRDTEQAVSEARDEAQQIRDQHQQPPPASDSDAQPDTAPPATEDARPEQAQTPEPAPAPAAAPAAAIPQQPRTTSSVGGIVDYQSAAIALYAAAERVEQYRTDLSQMADGLGGRKWGVEVHGPIRDMDTALAEIAGSYRDLAPQMQQQGDAVRDAEDAHPYVPGEHVVNA